MSRGQFDAIWVPRLGANGAETLWRWRRKTPLYLTAPIVGGGGSTLLAIGGALEAVAGVVLVLVAFGLVADFVIGQRRLKALVSQQFGVPVKGFPAMNEESFDRWCRYHGYEWRDAERRDR